jgi:hypothetical protein
VEERFALHRGGEGFLVHGEKKGDSEVVGDVFILYMTIFWYWG